MAATSPRSGVITVRDINNIPKFMADIPAIFDRIAQTVGDYLAGKIADKITKQDSSWAPLAASTIARKKSSKAWIDTGEIFALISNSVQSVRTEGTNPKYVQVGIFDNDKAIIAQFLEYGTNGGSVVAGGRIYTWNHIPERSLFRLVFDEEQENVIDLVHEEFGKEIDKLLIKHFS
jgi:hypothetical protein